MNLKSVRNRSSDCTRNSLHVHNGYLISKNIPMFDTPISWTHDELRFEENIACYLQCYHFISFVSEQIYSTLALLEPAT